MKKGFILLALILVSFLSACGGGSETPKSNTIPSSVAAASSSHVTSSVIDSSNVSSSMTSSSLALVDGPITPIPDSLWQPNSIGQPEGNYIYLESNNVEVFGAEQAKLFNHLNADIVISNTFRFISIRANGEKENWGEFMVMDSLMYPQVGLYKNTNNYSSYERNRARFRWLLSGIPACQNNEASWFAIDNVELDSSGKLSTIDLRFEQVCEGTDVYLRGRIHWDRVNKAALVKPVYPVPSDIWNKSLSEDVEEKNYLYVEYQPAAAGQPTQTKLLLEDTATFSLARLDKGVQVKIESSDTIPSSLTGHFIQASEFRIKEIEKGYYQNVAPFISKLNGFSLGLSGLLDVPMQDCDLYSGWFVVDDIHFVEGNPVSTTLRFEMDCKGKLRGKIRIINNKRTFSAGPVPTPAGLWEPSGITTSEDKNYIYLLSSPGDYIGQGKSYEHTSEDTLMTLEESSMDHVAASRLLGYVYGDDEWSFDLRTMPDQEKIKPGYYEFDGEEKNLFNWEGYGRHCNVALGWYAVDKVEYDELENLSAIDLRFEQHCEFAGAPPLYGKIHWRRDDATIPPGPLFPVPQDLWQPPATVTLPDYNYLYLESDKGDFVGDGKTYLLTQRDAQFKLGQLTYEYFDSPGNRYGIDIYGDTLVQGHFIKATAVLLEPGLYRFENGPNPIKGSLMFNVDSRGCNDNTGWFAIDDIAYDTGGNLLSIKYRFEQFCGGDPTSALRGKGYWRKHEPILPPGPILPIPSDLWRPVAQDVSAAGNYLYLMSEGTDPVGRGKKEVAKELSVQHANFTNNWMVIASAFTSQGHRIITNIKGMYFHDRLQAGYYPNIISDNPAKGHIAIISYVSCPNRNGWFAVDKVSYSPEGEITSLHVRFKQQCESSYDPLYGELKWDK